MKKKVAAAPLNLIQEYSEHKLTKDILIPLFYSIGFRKVDYHGGPYESGKDIT